MADRGFRRHGDDDDRRRDRRRSRSPGHRADRRAFGETDTYSGSRGYREREREERHFGRDRRDDWGRGDRDRGSARRDARRDDGDRRRDNRRDRDDAFERRRAPRDDRDRDRGARDVDPRRDREDMRQLETQAARRSASPPRAPKEPTPPLDDVISILERPRRLKQWDLKPQAFENFTAEQAKMSGQFPLPGAPRQQQMDPARLQAFMSQPGNQASSTALKPSTSRQAKRIVVTNFPPEYNDQDITQFFNTELNRLNIKRSNNSVQSVWMVPGNYAVVEFKTAEDATTALALRGHPFPDVMSEATNGISKGVQIKRPQDYIIPNSETGAETDSLANDSQHKLCARGIPEAIDEDQIKELFESFGQLHTFMLAKADGSDTNEGFAFCEYTNKESTDVVLESLNGMGIGDSTLEVQRACIGNEQVAGEMNVSTLVALARNKNDTTSTSRVLRLLNMLPFEQAMSGAEADELKGDLTNMCAKYGNVLEVKVPTPIPGSRQRNPGVGKIYVKFEYPQDAAKAHAALAGRTFNDRTIVTSWFNEAEFDVDAW